MCIQRPAISMLFAAEFLDPSLLKLKEYYVDVETTGELTAGETLS